MDAIYRVKCMWPWTKLTVQHHGYCYSCSPPWTKMGNVGRFTHQNRIMDIWNNERMQYIRQAVLDDRLDKVCNFRYCPWAINNNYLYIGTMKTEDPNYNHIIDQIMAGKTILDSPPYILEDGLSGKCNLQCVMCELNDHCLKYDTKSLGDRLYTIAIPEMLPKISLLSLNANGEVLFEPNSRKFLQSLNADAYPNLKIGLMSNGTLFTPKLWETIKNNRYESISISVDAASKATYEKIRRNGNWEVLRRNLEFISGLRRQKVFNHFWINFVVMKSNYREMKDFAELGIKLGCDVVLFQKIFGFADIRENINITHNKKALVEIAQTLTDPIFDRPDMDIKLLREYRKYLGKKVHWWNVMYTKGIEWLLYYPVKGVFSLAKYFSFVMIIYELLNYKRIPSQKRKEA